MTIERFRQRLRAVETLLKPTNSLAGKLDALTGEQRSCFEEWRERYERWIKRCKAQCPEGEDPDGHLYFCSLEAEDYGPKLPRENYEPKLRRNVEIALFGNAPTIPLTFGEDQAAQMWLNEVMR